MADMKRSEWCNRRWRENKRFEECYEQNMKQTTVQMKGRVVMSKMRKKLMEIK